MMTRQTTKNHGVLLDATTIRFERLLPGPIERVWEYLTDPDKRAEWFAGGPMELRVGGTAELRFVHADLSPHREEIPERYKEFENGCDVRARITQCDPPRLLGFTWGEASGAQSEVSMELSARGDKVMLVVTHRYLAQRSDLISAASGWHTHLGVLADRLAGATPKPFWSTHAEVERDYEEMLPEG